MLSSIKKIFYQLLVAGVALLLFFADLMQVHAGEVIKIGGVGSALGTMKLLASAFETLAHAFPDGRKGKIEISMHGSNDHRIRLSVSDNEIGFPEDLDFKNTASLGMQLVNSLVGQLDGTIELERGRGTKLRFVSLE